MCAQKLNEKLLKQKNENFFIFMTQRGNGKIVEDYHRNKICHEMEL
jgi:hypothetical protein